MRITILLTFLLDTIGMFYSTITGVEVMLVVTSIVAFITFGLGILVV